MFAEDFVFEFEGKQYERLTRFEKPHKYRIILDKHNFDYDYIEDKELLVKLDQAWFEFAAHKMAVCWYDCNCTDKALMIDYMICGHSIPDYKCMSIDELTEEYSEMFGY
jgi:hypothetical protein